MICVISNVILNWKLLISIWLRVISLENGLYSFGSIEFECSLRFFSFGKILLISDFMSKRMWASWNRYCLVLCWEVKHKYANEPLANFLRNYQCRCDRKLDQKANNFGATVKSSSAHVTNSNTNIQMITQALQIKLRTDGRLKKQKTNES